MHVCSQGGHKFPRSHVRRVRIPLVKGRQQLSSKRSTCRARSRHSSNHAMATHAHMAGLHPHTRTRSICRTRTPIRRACATTQLRSNQTYRVPYTLGMAAALLHPRQKNNAPHARLQAHSLSCLYGRGHDGGRLYLLAARGRHYCGPVPVASLRPGGADATQARDRDRQSGDGRADMQVVLLALAVLNSERTCTVSRQCTEMGTNRGPRVWVR
jgi:hypothetical protein